MSMGLFVRLGRGGSRSLGPFFRFNQGFQVVDDKKKRGIDCIKRKDYDSMAQQRGKGELCPKLK